VRDRYCADCQQTVQPWGHTRGVQLAWTLVTLPILVGGGLIVGESVGPNSDLTLPTGSPISSVPLGAVYGVAGGFALWLIGVLAEYTHYRLRCPNCKCRTLSRSIPFAASTTPPQQGPSHTVVYVQQPAAVSRRTNRPLGLTGALILLAAGFGIYTWTSDSCTLYLGNANLTMQGWGSKSACQQIVSSNSAHLANFASIVERFFTSGLYGGPTVHEGAPSGDTVCDGWDAYLHYTVRDHGITGLNVIGHSLCDSLRSATASQH
jgi:hypothetical protein